MSTWHYVKDGQKQGPVETVALTALISSGELPASALVWKTGMENWVAANSLPEFAQSAPPSVPNSVPPSVPAGGGLISDSADVDKNKVFGILAYFGILFIVPLLAAKESKFAMYHANQGLVLFLATILFYVAATILMMLPFLGSILGWFVLPAVWIVVLVLSVLGIVNAAQGACKPLPLIGQFTILK